MLQNILSHLKSTVDRFIKIEITQVNVCSYNNLRKKNSRFVQLVTNEKFFDTKGFSQKEFTTKYYPLYLCWVTYNNYLNLILTLLNAAKFSLFDELCQFL